MILQFLKTTIDIRLIQQ